MTRTPSIADDSCAGFRPADYRALLTGDVEDFHDSDGRPVGEIRASAESRRGVETELRQCPYQGSRHRHDKPMNYTALRQATRDWPDILGAIDLLRRDWVAAEGCASPNLVDVGRIAQLTALLPAYLLFRAEDGAGDGALPPFAAAIHKMVTGIISVCQLVAVHAIARGERPEDIAPSAELLHRVSEDSGLLAGRGGEVCAGPPGMIDEILRLYIEGGARTRVSFDAIERWVPDRRAFFTYADAATDLSFLVFVLAIQLEDLRRRAVAVATDGAPGLAAELEALAATGLGADRLHHVAGLPDPVRAAVVAVVLSLTRGIEPSEVSALAVLPPADAAPVIAAARADLAAPVIAELAALLAAMLAVEQRALTVIARCQRAIHAGLGLPVPPHALDSAELQRVFGPSPATAVAAALGIRAEIHPGGAAIAIADRSTPLDRLAAAQVSR